MTTVANPIFNRIYSLKDSDDCIAVYEEWADNYDKDVSGEDYMGPIETCKAVLAAQGNVNGTILDAGCGTGLCGVALAQAGAKQIDGIDISPGMLRVAGKTGVYRSLNTADLSKPIKSADDSYDVLTCVGTLTKTHVGPSPALKEFVRVTKKGGIIAATVLDEIWVPGGYEAEVNRLAAQGSIDILSTDKADYRSGLMARIVVLRVR